MEASSALLPGSPEVLGLAGSVPLGVIITPLAPLPTAEPLRRDVLRCAACAGVICEHCRLDGSAWICALCGHCNKHTAQSGPLQRRPVLSADAVEYAPLDTQPGNASSGAVRISIPDAPVPSITALLVDESASGAQLAAVRRALTDALPELSRADSHLALISYGAAVSVYRLGEPTEPAVPSAVVLPADAPDGASIGVLRAGAAQHVAPAQLGATAALAALEALAPPPDADDAASPGGPSAHGIVGALEVALQLIHLASAPPPSRLRATLVVISAGEWTGGDALADLGSRLCARHATVHVAADSLRPLGMRAMRRLLLPCNGSALLTRGAHDDAAEAERIERHVAETLARSAGRAYAAEIEIRTSRNLEVDQIAGPVSARAARAEAANGPAGAADSAGGIVAREPICAIAALDATTSICTLLTPCAPSPDERGCVQAVVTYTTGTGERRLRARTICLRVAADAPSLVRALDPRRTALLWARQLVLRCAESGGDGVGFEEAVDAAARSLVARRDAGGALGSALGVLGALGGARRAECPRALEPLLAWLYALRRSGAASARVGGGGDAMELHRHLLLGASPDAARRLVAPRLWRLADADARGADAHGADIACEWRGLDGHVDTTVSADGRAGSADAAGGAGAGGAPMRLRLDEVPAADLQLLALAELLLDAGTELIVWRDGDRGGAGDTPPLLRLARVLARSRSPPASVVLATAGTPSARWMVCRLAPCRRDAPSAQHGACPASLARLPTLERARRASARGRTPAG